VTTIYLVRHGQASFGAANYDQLSPLGERQGALLGRWWRQTGVAAPSVVVGAMQRHLREATVALAREDLKGARYDEQQGRDCLSRVAAYLLSLGDETITAALERMNHE
jgi:broad specificity phosphatase PhoE